MTTGTTRVLLVGGHTRSIGKTALVVDIIRAFPDAAWTAAKITQYGHGLCSINGKRCDCAPQQHSFALDEETSRDNRTDTSRFLVAGATRSLWLRTKQGRLAEAMPLLGEALRDAGNVIIESNSLMDLLRPALYLVVLDPASADFKASARQHLGEADAFILRSELPADAWPDVSPGLLADKPAFQQRLGAPLPAELAEFVQRGFFRRLSGVLSHPQHLSS
ncbi:MAG: hypothetical protein ACRD5G_13015 [Candidatus Acidiferrales bacterium]